MSNFMNVLLKERYLLIRPLGKGTFGTVYRALDKAENKICAVKVSEDLSEDAARIFQREAQILSQLSHPNLPRVHECFSVDGKGQFIVMDYIDGEDLQTLVFNKREMFTEELVKLLASQIGNALTYMHSRTPPVIHRDIKPDNIRITPENKVFLVDFGISKIIKAGPTTRLARAVSDGYSPPEQYGLGATDTSSDIYAFGATLYTLLTGIKPPASVDIIAGKVGPVLPIRTINPKISIGVSNAIAKAMSLDSRDRFSDIQLFLAELYRGDTRHTFTTRISDNKSKNTPIWWTFFSLALLSICIFAGIVGVLQLRPQPHPTPTVIFLANLSPSSPTSTSLPSSTPTSLPSSTPTLELTPTPTPVPTLAPGATRISPKDQMVQHYVPAGEFLFGTDSVKVYIDAFWIDETEVTNGKYQLCVQGGACDAPSKRSFTHSSYYGNPMYFNYPVIYVSWEDASNYCKWAGRRLPLEKEWEKAARGVVGQQYPWGNEPDCKGISCCNLANYWEYERYDRGNASRLTQVGCNKDTVEVGSYPQSASPYGALDMFGNVSEWVEDWFTIEFSKVVRDPFGFITETKEEDVGDDKIERGSDYFEYGGSSSGATSGRGKDYDTAIYTFVFEVSYRTNAGPNTIYYSRGFRCAAPAEN